MCQYLYIYTRSWSIFHLIKENIKMPNNHYINSDQSVFNDAKALFNLNKIFY